MTMKLDPPSVTSALPARLIRGVTSTFCAASTVLPDRSDADHTTELGPGGNGPELSTLGTITPSRASLAVASPKSTCVSGPVDTTSMSSGTISTGG